MKLRLVTFFGLLAALAASAQGTFYVSFGDGSIRSIDAQGRSSLFASSSIYPYGLAVDRSGTLYACDSLYQIYRFDTAGRATLFANTGPRSGSVSLAFGPDGYLYAANYLNSTITRYDQQGRQSLFATGEGLYLPRAVAFGPEGSLYVANRDGTIYRFDSAGRPALFASTAMRWPSDLAFDAAGNLFVPDFWGAAIYRFNPQGEGSLFAQTENMPRELAIDTAGNLFVTFAHLGAIQRFDSSGNASTFFDTGPFGDALGIVFIPEPAPFNLLLIGLALIILRRRLSASDESGLARD